MLFNLQWRRQPFCQLGQGIIGKNIYTFSAFLSNIFSSSISRMHIIDTTTKMRSLEVFLHE